MKQMEMASATTGTASVPFISTPSPATAPQAAAAGRPPPCEKRKSSHASATRKNMAKASV